MARLLRPVARMKEQVGEKRVEGHTVGAFAPPLLGASAQPHNQEPAMAFINKTTSRISEGQPFPRGANWDGLGFNLALLFAPATKVELCLFDEAGETELERI